MIGYWLSSGRVDRKTIVYRSSLVEIKKLPISTRSTQPLFDPYPIASRSTRSLFNLFSRSTRPLPDRYSIEFPIATRPYTSALDSDTILQKGCADLAIFITCYEHEEITSTTSRMSRKGRKTCFAAAFFNHEATTLSPPPSNSRHP